MLSVVLWDSMQPNGKQFFLERLSWSDFSDIYRLSPLEYRTASECVVVRNFRFSSELFILKFACSASQFNWVDSYSTKSFELGEWQKRILWLQQLIRSLTLVSIRRIFSTSEYRTIVQFEHWTFSFCCVWISSLFSILENNFDRWEKIPKVAPYYLFMLDFKKLKEASIRRTLSMVSKIAFILWNHVVTTL